MKVKTCNNSHCDATLRKGTSYPVETPGGFCVECLNCCCYGRICESAKEAVGIWNYAIENYTR